MSLESCYHPQGRKSSTVFQMVCMMIDREFLGFDLMRRVKTEYINAALVAQNGTGQLAIQTLSRCAIASQNLLKDSPMGRKPVKGRIRFRQCKQKCISTHTIWCCFGRHYWESNYALNHQSR